MSRRVVVLCQDGPASRAIVASLRRRFDPVSVVMEPHVPRHRLLRGRLRRLGPGAVAGQVGFMMLALPLLRLAARQRRLELIRANPDFDQPVEVDQRVPSVNSAEARRALNAFEPAVVVVSGTRIIGAATLAAVSAPLINMHAGITPAYRGVHGGYWALADGQAGDVGTTIHLIDAGIDTGAILAQARFTPTARDNFSTYPYLHTLAGLPHLLDAVADALEGKLQPIATAEGPSQLRHHPTLLQYVTRRITAGAR